MGNLHHSKYTSQNRSISVRFSCMKREQLVPCQQSKKPHHKPATHRLAAAKQLHSSPAAEPIRNHVDSTSYRFLPYIGKKKGLPYVVNRDSQFVQSAGTTTMNQMNNTTSKNHLPYIQYQAKPMDVRPQPSTTVVIVDHRQPSQNVTVMRGCREEMSVHRTESRNAWKV
jgi:hypothetical protein